MKHFFHLFGHALWIGAQSANAVSGIVPTPYQGLVAAGIATVQAAHAFYMSRQAGAAHA